MNGLKSFYSEFYGVNFFRHFRRPPDFNYKRLQIQYTAKTPQQLCNYVYRDNGKYPCFVHVYNHGTLVNLKNRNTEFMELDRAFFDFDISNPEAKKIKKQIQSLSRQGVDFEPKKKELQRELRDLIINEQIAKLAIDEAKDLSIKFKKCFGSELILFFSGCKGCHAYSFFNPIHNVNINRAVTWFAENVKNNYEYITMDLSVVKDALCRLSRVPYSQHQITGLTVVPFTLEDSYSDIMERSLKPQVKPFQRKNYHSSFGSHLGELDQILKQNEEIRKIQEKSKQYKRAKWTNNTDTDFKSFSGINDHRNFFRDLLGSPKSEHTDKEYVMYCCPFPDHEDNNPSFKVHRTNYECYGCGKKGNLARKNDYLEFKKMMGE